MSRRLHIGSHPITETTCDHPQCWCNGGSVPVITTDEELADYWAQKSKPRDPLLYTQAQVDALLNAAREHYARLAETADCGHPFVADWDDATVAIAALIRSGK